MFPIQKKSYGQPAAACCEAIGLTYSSVAASVAASLGNIVLVVPKYKGEAEGAALSWFERPTLYEQSALTLDGVL